MLCILLENTASAQTPTPAINPGTPWPATDGLGRSLPTTPKTGGLLPDRCVGIFYFLWHDQPWNSQQVVRPPNDLAKILKWGRASHSNIFLDAAPVGAA